MQPGKDPFPLERDHPPSLDREREPALLERQRMLAEQFAPPTLHCGHVGLVVGGDAVEFVDGGDHFSRDAMPLRGHTQQHFEELHGRLSIDRGLRAIEPRQGLGIARQPALDCGDDGFAPFRALEPPGQRPQAAEPFDGGRCLHCNVADDVVLEHAPARHITFLSLALAPSCDLDQNGKLSGLANARLQALPGVFGLEAISAGRGESPHLLLHPVAATAPIEIGGELEVDIAQMGYVGNRIGKLRSAQWPSRPVGEAMRFVEAVAGDPLHQLVVGNRVAVAQHHGSDLRVDDGSRDDAGLVPADLDVLAPGMKDLDNSIVRHQVEKRTKLDAFGKRIDDHRLIRARHLGDTELGIIGAFPQEFGIDRHEAVAR